MCGISGFVSSVTPDSIEIRLIALLALAVLMLALIAMLMVGAGRRYNGDNGKVYFTAIDRPWLDMGFIMLITYEAVIFYVFYLLIEEFHRNLYTRLIIVLCAVFSVMLVLPLLWWLTSFAKYCKAGKWWRHTFMYALIRGVKKFLKSLWAGFPLTLKALAIGFALFLLFYVFLNIHSHYSYVFFAFTLTAAAVFGMLRYARKLHLLEQGAKAASGGHYGDPIAVVGGTLGNIAASINNISNGINAAVAERTKSERFKTELITNISHDIRTPLTSLITYTDLLKSEGLNSENAPKYLDILIQKSARLKTLTDDLFEASKAASGNIEVHTQTLDLADFIRQLLGELDEKISASGLEFRPNLPEHAFVLADGKLLWRVVDNLLSNVFKYSLPGSRVYIDVAEENGAYRMDIKNISKTPLNIDPSELMERFVRGDESRAGEGSGLGLSIAQSFVLSQGGEFALSIDGDLFKASVRLPKA